jgi:hypothetical protein
VNTADEMLLLLLWKLFAISNHILWIYVSVIFCLNLKFVYKLVEHFLFLNISLTLSPYLFVFDIYAGHLGRT